MKQDNSFLYELRDYWNTQIKYVGLNDEETVLYKKLLDYMEGVK